MNLRRIIAFITISSLAIIFSITASSYNFLQTIENKSWDFRLRITAQGQSEADPRIKLIIVDQASLDLYASEQGITWPWPRTLYIPVMRYLKAAGAKGIAFDIIFSEGSIHGVEEDQEFASELKGEIPIVSTVAPALSGENIATNQLALESLNNRQLQENKKSLFAAHYLTNPGAVRFSSATLPVQEILENSPAFGSAWAQPDKDGIFRHYWPGGYIENVPLLSLSLALYNSSEENKTIDNFESLLDSEGRLTVKFHGGQQTYQTIPIADVISSYVIEFEESGRKGLQPPVDLETFKDAWVFIGVWAPGLLDLRPAPLDEVYKGVEYHATVLDNLINRDFILKVPPILNTLYSAIFVLLITAPVFFLRRQSLEFLSILAVALLFFYSGYFLTTQGYWIKMVIPLLSITLALIISLGFQYYSEGRERKFIKNAFGRYVSPKLIQKIIEDPKSLALGGEKRELTIFFSDLAGFTTISESLPAEKLVSLLNIYLGAMTDIILESGATLDKYEGDAIIAFWNAPVSIENHPYCGVKAALDCQKKLVSLRPQFKKEFGVDLFMRIGLHTGIVNVGNFGSADRFDYTVIGDAANLAARLEGVNKIFSTSVLISEQCYQKLEGKIPCRRLGAIRVVGKSEAINVYEPLDSSRESSQLETFAKGLSEFELGKLSEAAQLFANVPNDLVADSYLQRIHKELNNPGATWDPVWNLTSK